MGQGSSQPERRTENSSRLHRRPTGLRRSIHAASSDEGQQAGLLSGRENAQHSTPRLRTRSGSVNRLSQLLHLDSASLLPGDGDAAERPRGAGVLQRTRTTVRDMLSRREQNHVRTQDISTPTPTFVGSRASYIRSGMRTGMNSDGDDYYPHPPRLPSIDLTSSFDRDAFDPSEDHDHSLPRSSSSNRRSNLRLTALRPDRPFRHFPMLRRRRQSPDMRRYSGAEDQAAMLSRLLSVAAAATAATLMGDDHHALLEARSLTGSTGVGDIGGAGEDGSFDGFLRALQNGRIASALRGGRDSETDVTGGDPNPLNFFRMFRFASSPAQEGETAPRMGGDGDGYDSASEGRMIPIIIVGIRSITPTANGLSPAASAEHLPPFIDALGNFPTQLPNNALGAHGHDSIDSILRPPQNGTSFRHRRRASLGGFGMSSRNRLSDRMDDQRDHRSPDRRRDRPWSVASSSSALEPRPPPATPASPSPELSRISSRNNTPGHSRPTSTAGNSSRDLGDSRRNSVLHRTSAASPLSSHTEETVSLHSTHSSTNLLSSGAESDSFRYSNHRRSDTVPNVHYPRFTSGHSRRHGVVEPLGDLPSLSRSSTTTSNEHLRSGRRSSSATDSRSWIIYVLGGSYPENHPILTTPSLFTDNPTYEDMMLLSALLGPGKAPVATEEDVESAGGIYNIMLVPSPSQEDLDEPSSSAVDAAKTASLVAVAVEDEEDRVHLEAGQRCLVCLCDFEVQEVARKLVKCQHVFHRDCIDQWLTQGRNSCPLCRGQGVDEKERSPDDAASAFDDDEEAAAQTEPGASSSSTLNDSVIGARSRAGNAEVEAQAS